ncbi:MAG: SGNH/GDSL hydrolase family protein [Clostridia bacterium]|nr:SGNH/GDSL hydrolase family protein [Clostridia bacterium]
MELKNKTVCFLGDSITEGAGSSSPDKCFVSLFAKAHPEAKVHNFGIGGTRIAKQIKPSEKSRWDRYFGGRVADMPKTADLICIFGGTNDYGHGDVPFGSFGDTDEYTFSGAVYTLMHSLVEKYPNAKIVIFTPLHRVGERVPAKRLDGEFILRDYVERIKETAEYFSLPILDLWSVSGLQPEIEIIKEKFMPDGLHPNDEGYIKLFDIINKYLNML